MLSKIGPRYWALASLLAWGAIILGFGMLRLDGFGIDEGAAQALLLNWSAPLHLGTSATALGGPDFRALLFIPLGLYWPGSILAAKISMLLFIFTGCWILHHWRRDTIDSESALLATGLMLIAPVTLLEADAVGVGPFVLFIFGLGYLVDRKYRESPHQINSWYFVQTLLIAIASTLHPIGLAYPLTLAWHWQQDPKSAQHKKLIWIGTASAVLIVAIMHTGWINLHWFSNPFLALSDAVTGLDPTNVDPERGIWGLLPAALLILVSAAYLRQSGKNLLSNMLLLASWLGWLAADMAWAYVVTAFILYQGIPQLIALNNRYSKAGFVGQRGALLVIFFIVTTSFMQTNRSYASYIASGLLSPSDELIQHLAGIIASKDVDEPIIASQWPARTMIICKCDVLRLPPASPSGAELLSMIKGITHITFNQNDPANSALAKNFSELSAETETLAVMQGGVIIKVRDRKSATSTDTHNSNSLDQKSSTPN